MFGGRPNVFQQFLAELTIDTKPPDYANLFIDQITTNSARINFKVFELGWYGVFIGTSLSIVQAEVSGTPGGATYPEGTYRFVGFHSSIVSFTITGLSDNTTYYLRPYLEDMQDIIELKPQVYSFTTSSDANPTISNVQVTPGQTSALMTFDTSEGCQGKVWWGVVFDVETDSTPFDAPGTINHSHTLTGLTHSTTYYWLIEVRDNVNNVTLLRGQFTTTTDPLPIISNINHSNLAKDFATISWNTDKPCTGQVLYGTSSGSYPNSTSESSPGLTSHSHNISGLSTFTTYYYKVRAKDAANQIVLSGEGSLTTLADPIAIGYSSANNGGGASFLTLAPPPGVLQNDVLVAAIAIFDGQQVSPVPAGWAELRARNNGTSRLVIYWKRYQPGDPTYSFTLSGTARANGGIAAIRNCKIVGVPFFASGDASDVNIHLTTSCAGPGVPTAFFAAGSVNADEGMSVQVGGFVEEFEPRSTRNMLGADKVSAASSETITFDIGTSINRGMLAIICSLQPTT